MEYKKIYNVPVNLARNNIITLPITSVCSSKCEFCMNNYNPFKIDKVGHRPLDEIEKVIDKLAKYFNNPIYLVIGGTVFGVSVDGSKVYDNRSKNHVSWGDGFLHPQLIKVLEMIREKFPTTTLCFHTTGTNLNKSLIENVAKFNPILVYISTVTIKKDEWINMYKDGEQSYDSLLESIKLLKENNIQVGVSTIPLLSEYGEDGLEDFFRFLTQNGINDIYINSPAYTKFSPGHVKDMFEHDRYKLADFLHRMRVKYNIFLTWPEDPTTQLDFHISPLITKLKQLNEANKKCYLFTSIAAYERFCEIINGIKKQYSITMDTEIIKVENRSYGGNIITAGLWTLSDIRDKIDELGLVGENVIIPNSFIDEYGFDIMRENIQDYFKVSKNQITILNIHARVS